MEPRVDVITLGVRDLAAARRFYVENLGWSARIDVPGQIFGMQVGPGLLLSMYGRDDLAAEAGDLYGGDLPVPVSLGYLVANPGAVTDTLESARAAGGTIVAPAQERPWGGVSGYFADPDGYRWEVIYNPGYSPSGTDRMTTGSGAD